MSAEHLRAAVQNSPLWITSHSFAASPEWPEWTWGVDALWYIRTYRSMAPGLTDPLECVEHYLRTLKYAPVSPNAAFDEDWYRGQYPDVTQTIREGRFDSGWHHYISVGHAEHRNPVWWFDEQWYRLRNAEVGQAVRSGGLRCGFEHYLLYGMRKDLAPSLYFNPSWYRREYLNGRDMLPIVHYQSLKNTDSCCPAPFFDGRWYQRQYLAGAATSPDSAGRARSVLEHYMFYGRELGYSPSPRFDEHGYRTLNPEASRLIETGVYASGWEHYVWEGVSGGAVAPTHLDCGALDYSGPRILEAYERSILLNLRQLHRIKLLSGQ